MAHRHTVQKRARGGRNLGPDYTGPASKRVLDEARSQKEDFNKGGKTVAKAHGGAAKKRGDFKRGGTVSAGLQFKQGGSVWSHAASGLRGKKGMAGNPEVDGHEEHGEKLDHKAHKGGTEGSQHRIGHKGKAKHQYAKGGKVKGFKQGGHIEDDHSPMNRHPQEEPEGEWQRDHKRGGRAHKHGGGECDDDRD